MRPARRPHGVPQPGCVGVPDGELPSELAGVGDPHGVHRATSDVDPACVQVRERAVGEVGVRERPQDVAHGRPPESEAGSFVVHRADRYRVAVGGVAQKPREVARAVPAEHEAVVRETRDRDVGCDTAMIVEQHRVRDGAGRPIDPTGGDPMQESGGSRPGDLDPREGGQVEQPRGLPHGAVLGDRDRRPVPRRPRVARRHAASVERGVRRVPLRPFPGRHVNELGVEGALPIGERAPTDPTRRPVRLGRVMGDVDVHVLVDGARLDEGPLALRAVEPREVRDGRVDRRPLPGYEVRDDTRDAHGVCDPDGLRHPETGDVGMLADQRVAVGREPEDSVEAPFDRRLAERGHELARALPRILEVLWREPVGQAALRVPRMPVEVIGRDRQPAMVERADADPVAVIAVVDADVVMPDDRAGGLAGPPRRRARRSVR